MSQFRAIRLMLLACFLAPALAGCIGGKSPASRFYTLAPQGNVSIPVRSGPDVLLMVGPVSVPDYLDRQQIVTRSGRNEIVIDEFNRWGGSFEGEVTRALVAGISNRLAPGSVEVLPWKPVALFAAARTYLLPISIARFDGVPGEMVVLNARWEVVMKKDGKDEPLRLSEVTITEKIDGPGYDALVAAMQNALDRFGKELADSIASSSSR